MYFFVELKRLVTTLLLNKMTYIGKKIYSTDTVRPSAFRIFL